MGCSIQGKGGQGSEKPNLVEGVAAYCSGAGLDNI